MAKLLIHEDAELRAQAGMAMVEWGAKDKVAPNVINDIKKLLEETLSETTKKRAGAALKILEAE